MDGLNAASQHSNSTRRSKNSHTSASNSRPVASGATPSLPRHSNSSHRHMSSTSNPSSSRNLHSSNSGRSPSSRNQQVPMSSNHPSTHKMPNSSSRNTSAFTNTSNSSRPPTTIIKTNGSFSPNSRRSEATTTRSPSLSPARGPDFVPRTVDTDQAMAQHQLYDDEYGQEVVQALIDQAYHLPGNTWWEDWAQFMFNNHPVLGICFHHPAHPAKPLMRVLTLMASVGFGLVVTNIFYLTWIYYEENYEYALVDVQMVNATGISVIDNSYNDVQITTGMLVLWIVGSAVHGLFDMFMWLVATGSLCGANSDGVCGTPRCKSITTYLVIAGVILIAGLGSFAMVIRASLTTEDEVNPPEFHSAGLVDDNIDLGNVDGAEIIEFLIGYSVELAIALAVSYPLCGTVLFSGLLGCGCLPILGGRPREMRLERKKLSTQNASSSSDSDHDGVEI